MLILAAKCRIQDSPLLNIWELEWKTTIRVDAAENKLFLFFAS
jgi:hypothetical protein